MGDWMPPPAECKQLLQRADLAKDGVNCAGLEVTADEGGAASAAPLPEYVAAADGHTLEGVLLTA